MKNFTAVAAVSAIFTSKAYGWSINGHMLVANIAEQHLLKESSSSLDQANAILKTLYDYDRELTSHEKDHSFVECATFADDIKYHGGGWQSDYHFFDSPWLDHGDFPGYKPEKNTRTLLMALDEITQWLSNGRHGTDYKKSYMYDYIQNKLYPGREDLAQSYALRLLIHYVGDVHQPLHNEDRYDADYPSGDKGGNDFPLKNHYDCDELHAVWDKVIYSQHKNLARPITDWSTFLADTNSMDSRRKGSIGGKSNYQNVNFDKWSNQAYDIAITAYDGLTPGSDQVVPDWYIDKFVPVAETQITLGGYRLAYLMEYIYPAKSAFDIEDIADYSGEFVNDAADAGLFLQ